MPRSRSRSPGRRGGGGGGDRGHRRSRSRSRERRRRHRSRSPNGDRGGGSSRHHNRSKHSRSRSRSPTSSHRRRDRSKSPDIFNKPSRVGRGVGEPEVTTGATNPDMLSPEMQIPVDGEVTQDAIDMIQLMGFSGFDSSKGKTHSDGAVKAHGASIQVKRKYRQYMNRRGGFNRPLDKTA